MAHVKQLCHRLADRWKDSSCLECATMVCDGVPQGIIIRNVQFAGDKGQ